MPSGSSSSLQDRGLAPEREEERPFENWSDHRLRHETHALTMRIRQADGGFGLSPLIDRNWLMTEELRERGLEDTVPGTEQIEQIEAELERREGPRKEHNR